jgi:hypothetical protein
MACHFLKDKEISISLRRRFQFWVPGVLSVFATAGALRTQAGRRSGVLVALLGLPPPPAFPLALRITSQVPRG